MSKRNMQTFRRRYCWAARLSRGREALTISVKWVDGRKKKANIFVDKQGLTYGLMMPPSSLPPLLSGRSTLHLCRWSLNVISQMQPYPGGSRFTYRPILSAIEEVLLCLPDIDLDPLELGLDGSDASKLKNVNQSAAEVFRTDAAIQGAHC